MTETCPNCGCVVSEHRYGGIGVCRLHGCEDTREDTRVCSFCGHLHLDGPCSETHPESGGEVCGCVHNQSAQNLLSRIRAESVERSESMERHPAGKNLDERHQFAPETCTPLCGNDAHAGVRKNLTPEALSLKDALELSADAYEDWLVSRVEELENYEAAFTVVQNLNYKLQAELDAAKREQKGVPFEWLAEEEEKVANILRGVEALLGEDFSTKVDFPDGAGEYTARYWFEKGVLVVLEAVAELLPDPATIPEKLSELWEEWTPVTKTVGGSSLSLYAISDRGLEEGEAPLLNHTHEYERITPMTSRGVYRCECGDRYTDDAHY